LAYHGRARATQDLDVWIARDLDNAERVYHALAQFGAPLERLTQQDFAEPDQVIQLGVAPIRIDILTDVEGITFEQAWPNRSIAQYGNVLVSIVSRDDFIKNKRAVGRLRDLADIESLET
jgi:hypothetical protein